MHQLIRKAEKVGFLPARLVPIALLELGGAQVRERAAIARGTRWVECGDGCMSAQQHRGSVLAVHTSGRSELCHARPELRLAQACLCLLHLLEDSVLLIGP
eukprot:scaffold230291_cov35-Tisochrysis_lutea.AAC.3